MSEQVCWLAQFSDRPCDGRLVRAHLIPRQTLRRELGRERAEAAIEDERSWVPACGGLLGLAAHHHAADSYQLRIPPEKLPVGFLELLDELGLLWYAERRYGALTALLEQRVG